MGDTEIFKLNLDASEFMEALKKSSESLEKLGEGSEGLQKIISAIGTGTELVGAMGIAFLAAKSALDWAQEAEEIKRVNDLFENLTQQSGIATETLREGLEKASNGMIASTELTKLGNKAIIELGTNAAKLPEIMTLAQKTTQVFGGSLTNNFESISQAIANGNTRMLKHMGIIVDANKAYVDYAKSIGSTVDQLSQSEKQAAIMNAVLEQGAEKFKNVKVESDNTTTAIAQIKTTVSEMGETFSKIFGTLVMPAVKGALNATKVFLANLKGWGDYLSDKIVGSTAKWGESLDVTNKQLDQSTENLHKMQVELAEIESRGRGFWDTLFGGSKTDQVAKLKADIQTTISEINGLQKKKEEFEKEGAKKTEEGGADAAAANEAAKAQQRLAHRTQFNKEMVALQDKLQKEIVAGESSTAEVEKNFDNQKYQMAADLQQKLDQIRERAAAGKLSPAEAKALEVEQTRIYNQQLANLDDDLTNRKIAALNRFSKESDKASEQFGAGWQAAGLKAIQSNSNFSTMGQAAFQTIGSRATQAFKSIGAGSANAGQAMKTFFLGALGDMATKQGEFFLMQGLGFSATPGGQASGGVLIAEGAGLIALGGLLGSMSGGGSSPSSGGGGGAAATPAGVDTTGGAAPGSAAPTPTPQKTVTVQIMGHVFNTDDTKNAIMNLIRQETDATDFKYQQIGV